MAGAALLRHLGPRLFAAEPVTGLAAARILPARMSSTAVEAAKEAAAPEEQRQKPEAPGPEGQDKKAVVSYWGIQPRKLVKEDGTEWRWFCFRVST
jgi:ubiquinol oxidase